MVLVWGPHFENHSHRPRTGLTASSVSPGKAGRSCSQDGAAPQGQTHRNLLLVMDCVCVGGPLSEAAVLFLSDCTCVAVYTCVCAKPEGGQIVSLIKAEEGSRSPALVASLC